MSGEQGISAPMGRIWRAVINACAPVRLLEPDGGLIRAIFRVFKETPWSSILETMYSDLIRVWRFCPSETGVPSRTTDVSL